TSSDRAGTRDVEEESAGIDADLTLRAVGRNELDLLDAADVRKAAQDDVLPAQGMPVRLSGSDRDRNSPCKPLVFGGAAPLLAFSRPGDTCAELSALRPIGHDLPGFSRDGRLCWCRDCVFAGWRSR